MDLLLKICSSDTACSLITNDEYYNSMSYEQKLKYLKNSVKVHVVSEAFNPWCYIAGYLDFKHQFWNYDRDTLNEDFACLVYIEHGFKVGLKRNLGNLCTADAKYKLKPKCKIAVVGNAPISEKQQDQINDHDIVIRTNNCESYRPGDRVDIVYYRGVRIKNAKEFPFSIVKSSNYTKVMHLDGMKMDEVYFRKQAGDWHYYESIKSDTIEYQKNKDKHRASCGYFTIRDTQKRYPESEVYLYGFTFNVIDPRFHNLKYEREKILNEVEISDTLHYVKPDTKSKKVHHGM